MITSMDNKTYKTWLKLTQKKYRLKEGMFLIEGEHLIIEAEKAGVLKELILREGVSYDTLAPTTYLSKPLFEKLASTVTSAGIMAVCNTNEKEIVNKNRLLLVDNISDPGNLGTLIRSALAFGFDGMIVSVDTVDIYNDKVIRATQGSIFNLPIIRRNLTTATVDLQSSGVKVYATALNANAKLINDVPTTKKMAFIVGNEGVGVKQDLVAICDGCLKIEMKSTVESLNVGVAGSIVMHKFGNF